MSGKRIGERLSNMVPLSGHDIEEILSEQGTTGKRFGDIAIQLGLCSPEHIWRAWGNQLAEKPQRRDLDEFGIDAQAVEHLPRQVAVRYHVIPVRMLGDELVIAVDEAAYPEVAKELIALLGSKLIFVLSSHTQIARAIRSYYPQCTAA
jgi:type IV pilus assembly protein PilB